MHGNIISHARGGHACMHVPRNIYAIRQSLPTWRNHSCNMKLLVADNINYFRDGPRDLPKKRRYVDFNIVIDIDAEFDHVLDVMVWQNR